MIFTHPEETPHPITVTSGLMPSVEKKFYYHQHVCGSLTLTPTFAVLRDLHTRRTLGGVGLTGTTGRSGYGDLISQKVNEERRCTTH